MRGERLAQTGGSSRPWTVHQPGRLVDETTVNSDTDYVASAVAGDLDLYEVGDLPFTPEKHPCGAGDDVRAQGRRGNP